MRIPRFPTRFLFVFYASLILIFCGWLSLHWRASVQWREQPYYELSATQKTQLVHIAEPVTLEVYLSGNARLKAQIRVLTRRLQKDVPALQLRFIDPLTHPVEVQTANITREGEAVLQIGDYRQKLPVPSAAAILQTLLDRQSLQPPVIVHLAGYGTRDFLSDTPGAWQLLYKQLRAAGATVAGVDIQQNTGIPDNSNLLVIADPEPAQLNSLGQPIMDYLDRGGNLIYTTDTAHPGLPDWLAQLSGLAVIDGTVVDQAGAALGFADPRLIPVQFAENLPIVNELKQVPLLPGSIAFTTQEESPWQRQILLQSSAQSWAEKSDVQGHIQADPDETTGPLALAWLLRRPYQGGEQFIVILGDSDLWQTSALPIGGNQGFANAVYSHLSGKPTFSPLRRPQRGDQFIELPLSSQWLWALTLIIILPILTFCGSYLLRRRFYQRYQP